MIALFGGEPVFERRAPPSRRGKCGRAPANHADPSKRRAMIRSTTANLCQSAAAILIAALMLGCTTTQIPAQAASPGVAPTYTPYPTATALPTYTPYPTYTRYPTNTPPGVSPTHTPYPTATALPTETPYPTPAPPRPPRLVHLLTPPPPTPGATATPRPSAHARVREALDCADCPIFHASESTGKHSLEPFFQNPNPDFHSYPLIVAGCRTGVTVDGAEKMWVIGELGWRFQWPHEYNTILIRTDQAEPEGRCFAARTTYFGMGRVEWLADDIMFLVDLLIFNPPSEVIWITDGELNSLTRAAVP